MWHVWNKTNMRVGYGVSKPERKSDLEDLGVEGKVILKLFKF